MKKEYKLPEENPNNNQVNEPAVEYRRMQQKISFDIPEEYLLVRLQQAEKEIEEGKITPLSEIKRKIIP